MCYLGKSQVPVAICNSNSGLWGPRYSLEGASKEATLDNVGSLQVQKLAAYYVEPLKYNLLFISSKVK